MQILIFILFVGCLFYFLLKSVKEKSYRQGFQDGQRLKNREGSIDVEFKVVKDEEKKG
ncbi:MAG: hypothetical protein HPY50_18960 [Firmicutes bacterium]|nr:hypothetical protein [Bacillota bacterium]